MADRIVRTLTALVLALALAACVASTNPAGPESEAVAEKGLVGTWPYAGTNDDAWSYIHVLSLEKNRLQIVAINELRGDWAVLGGYITQAGPRRVMSVRLVSGSDGVRSQVEKAGRADHPYSFLVYRLEGKDRLVLAQGFNAIQTALKKGAVSGEAVNGGLLIADEPGRIAAVFGAASETDLFTGSTVYVRVPAP